jgi:hypothetical protein
MKPIVPTSRDPAEFDLTVTFTDFEVKKSDSTSSLLAKSGSLHGKVAPRTAIDSSTGACSISTPVVTFTDLSWSSGTVTLTTDGNKFNLSAGASMIQAQNGTKGTASNTISGAITIDGTSYSLMAPSEPLDTAFDQARFDLSYACTPRIVIPPVDAACSFRQALGTAAARLIVKNFATATSMVNGNTTCGFSAMSVLGAGVLTGTPGQMGNIVWTANACAVGPLPANTTISTNCLGTQTKASGTVTATATKTVNGVVTGMANPPILPVTRNAAAFGVTSVNFNTFELYDLPMGVMTPATRSTLTGMGTVTVKPVAGQSVAASASAMMPVYSITTPVAGVEMLTLPAGSMTIVSDGNRFDVTLSAVALEAFTGSHMGVSNRVSGSLTVDGQPVMVAMMTPLDPAFMQATYDSTYVCTPDLTAVILP